MHLQIFFVYYYINIISSLSIIVNIDIIILLLFWFSCTSFGTVLDVHKLNLLIRSALLITQRVLFICKRKKSFFLFLFNVELYINTIFVSPFKLRHTEHDLSVYPLMFLNRPIRYRYHYNS